MKFINMTHKELITGNYYVAKRADWNEWIMQIKEVDENNVDVFVSITTDGSYYDSPGWSSDGENWEYREATSKEILWIQTCLSQGQFIPLEEIKELIYEIY